MALPIKNLLDLDGERLTNVANRARLHRGADRTLPSRLPMQPDRQDRVVQGRRVVHTEPQKESTRIYRQLGQYLYVLRSRVQIGLDSASPTTLKSMLSVVSVDYGYPPSIMSPTRMALVIPIQGSLEITIKSLNYGLNSEASQICKAKHRAGDY